jgi:AraC-like DNA-binding protein
VSSAGFMPGLDIFMRGGACALALLIALLLLRDFRGVPSARLGALFALGAAAFAATSAPGIQEAGQWWITPLQAFSAGNNVVFFLFASALFDDEFRFAPWHLLLWAAIMLASLGCALVPASEHNGLIAAIRPVLGASAVVFAALGGVKALKEWHEDLVEDRRRMRFLVVTASALYIGFTAAADALGAGPARSSGMSLAAAIGLVIITGSIAATLLQIDTAQALFPAPATSTAPEQPPRASHDISAADRPAIAALDDAMRIERIYRRDGLTVGQLAAHLGLPEHRLRRLINQGLGHRNFNTFLNGWRLGDVKQALSDPAQAAVPILTIALDAGFSSLGPFNRAFKAVTGITPTEYRRTTLKAPADFETGEPIAIPARSFPNSA